MINAHPDGISYEHLMEYLFYVEFIYSIEMDENRAAAGIDLRYLYEYTTGNKNLSKALRSKPCSVLEMMVALSNRIEVGVMGDSEVGDQTYKWFWVMIDSLGLMDMSDDNFDSEYVDDVIDKFLHREYEPDGTGGLFIIPDYRDDLRDIDIWYQVCAYLNYISEDE